MLKFVEKHKHAGYDYTDGWFPSLYEMEEDGIDFAIFDQRPGDAVIASSGCFHFVQTYVSCCFVLSPAQETWSIFRSTA